MSEKLGLYKCGICGNIAEIVIEGSGTLVCCSEEMKLLEAATTDGALEKHVPVVVHYGASHVIKVGEMPHPMVMEHYIQFIEAISKDRRYIKRKYLYPGEEPEMVIKCLMEGDFEACEYCNIHGLYKGGNNGN